MVLGNGESRLRKRNADHERSMLPMITMDADALESGNLMRSASLTSPFSLSNDTPRSVTKKIIGSFSVGRSKGLRENGSTIARSKSTPAEMNGKRFTFSGNAKPQAKKSRCSACYCLFKLILFVFKLALFAAVIMYSRPLFSKAVAKYQAFMDETVNVKHEKDGVNKKFARITEEKNKLSSDNNKLEGKFIALENEKREVDKLYEELQLKQKDMVDRRVLDDKVKEEVKRMEQQWRENADKENREVYALYEELQLKQRDMVDRRVLDDKVREEVKRIEQQWRENSSKEVGMLQRSIQEESKRQIAYRFGKDYGPSGPYKIEFKIEIPHQEGGNSPSVWYFTVETAPVNKMPHSLNIFLRQIELKLWDGCTIPINSDHKLFANSRNKLEDFQDAMLTSVTFRERSDYPSEAYSIGFHEMNGLPEIYINTKIYQNAQGDNKYHSAFGKVFHGRDVIDKVASLPASSGQLQTEVIIKRAYLI